MSNAEDHVWIDEMDEDWESLKRIITTFAKAHTNQTLDKLKDELRSIERGTCMIHLGEAINKIDETINE